MTGKKDTYYQLLISQPDDPRFFKYPHNPPFAERRFIVSSADRITKEILWTTEYWIKLYVRRKPRWIPISIWRRIVRRVVVMYPNKVLGDIYDSH